jgi:hypothetical protein
MSTQNVNTQGAYPLSNPAYDVISILHKKSKALEAYEKFVHDFSSDTQLTQILIEIRHDEQRHIELLKAHLARLLHDPNQQAGTSSTSQ